MLVQALELSVLVAGLSTLCVGVAGTWAGWLMARSRWRAKEWIDALLMLPLVLPPTVTGYYLIVLLGRRGWIGTPVFAATGLSVPFTWIACVIAAAVISFPLMFRAARVAFEELDSRHELAAASLGHGRFSIFLRILLPLARRGLLAGLVLSFARGLGEFGATLMLAGNIPGRTQTLPLAIYEAVATGDDRSAVGLAMVLTTVSVVVIVAASRLGRGRA